MYCFHLAKIIYLLIYLELSPKKERNNPTETLFSKKFGIDMELAEFAINKVLEIGDQLKNFVTTQQIQPMNYPQIDTNLH